jgi:hypothetical protein
MSEHDEPAKKEVSSDTSAIEVDVYGIKARIEPTETGEPDPKTWKEVGRTVNKTLMALAVNLVRAPLDLVVGTRMIWRGLARIPASIAGCIEQGHKKAERLEAKAQEKAEQENLPPPPATKSLDLIESLILKTRAEGFAAEIVEREDGSVALVFVKPEDRANVGPLIQKALPPPALAGEGQPKKSPRRTRRKKPEAGA